MTPAKRLSFWASARIERRFKRGTLNFGKGWSGRKGVPTTLGALSIWAVLILRLICVLAAWLNIHREPLLLGAIGKTYQSRHWEQPTCNHKLRRGAPTPRDAARARGAGLMRDDRLIVALLIAAAIMLAVALFGLRSEDLPTPHPRPHHQPQ